MERLFTFEAQAEAYCTLFNSLLKKRPNPAPVAA
jgi:hypothetical protein